MTKFNLQSCKLVEISIIGLSNKTYLFEALVATNCKVSIPWVSEHSIYPPLLCTPTIHRSQDQKPEKTKKQNVTAQDAKFYIENAHLPSSKLYGRENPKEKGGKWNCELTVRVPEKSDSGRKGKEAIEMREGRGERARRRECWKRVSQRKRPFDFTDSLLKMISLSVIAMKMEPVQICCVYSMFWFCNCFFFFWKDSAINYSFYFCFSNEMQLFSS